MPPCHPCCRHHGPPTPPSHAQPRTPTPPPTPTAQGRRARFVPGWDCHGLPIELKVLQSMPDEERRGLTPIELRRKAAEFALRTVDAQREQFKR